MKLSKEEFVKKIRDKYPGSYTDLSDDELLERVLKKYPKYKDQIDFGSTKEEQNTSLKSVVIGVSIFLGIIWLIVTILGGNNTSEGDAIESVESVESVESEEWEEDVAVDEVEYEEHEEINQANKCAECGREMWCTCEDGYDHCSKCGGTGWYGGKVCLSCSGRGIGLCGNCDGTGIWKFDKCQLCMIGLKPEVLERAMEGFRQDLNEKYPDGIDLSK